MPRVCFASRSSLHPASAQDSYLDGAPELSIERPYGSLCPSGCQSDLSNLKNRQRTLSLVGGLAPMSISMLQLPANANITA